MKKTFTIFSAIVAVVIGLEGITPVVARTNNGHAVAGKPVVPAISPAQKNPASLPKLNVGQSTPLVFIENKGQITDQEGNQRPDIQYRLAAAKGLSIFVGNGAIHYQFSKNDNSDKKPVSQTPNSEFQTATYTMYRMDVELIGANKNAEVITEQKQDYYENYFTPGVNKDAATAYTYKKITYKDVYPNIDWVLYVKDGQLAHEFVVRQGGNVADIKLKYGGATGLKINKVGSLVANTPQGAVTEQAPYTYQKDGTKVTSSFKLKGNILSYETGIYTGDLVIDPGLAWATYYGGSSSEGANGVATDGAGNVYITGQTTSTSGIATSGAYQTSFLSGGNNCFLAKLNSSGTTLEWGTYYCGTSSVPPCVATAVATDRFGNEYITGYVSIGIMYNYYILLAKFDSTGALKWGTYFGGTTSTGGGAQEGGTSLATDRSGNVYITGYTNAVNGIATSGAYQPAYNAGGDAFLTKFDSTGTLQWGTYYGGVDRDQGNSVSVDTSGNVYMGGLTATTSGLASSGAYETSMSGTGVNLAGFIAEFNSSGSRIWATYFGSNPSDVDYIITSVANDVAGNVYIAGNDNFSAQSSFLGKFNNAGVFQWSASYGSATTYTTGLAVDTVGNIYMAGYTNATSGMTTAGAYQTAYGGGTNNGFLAQFNNTGTRNWASYYGGSSNDQINAIAIGGAGSVYIAGSTSSTGMATSGAYQTTNAGGGDAVLAKFDCFPSIAPITGTTTICAGSITTLSDITTGGVWSSTATGVATVDGSGNVTGVAGGTTTISYTVTYSCGLVAVTHIVTVTGAPTITTVTPLVGYPASAVTITGTGFNTIAANDVVYFGATRATVTGASSTSLSVTVPTGATYQFVTVDNLGCNLTSYSEYPFLQDYNNSAYAPGGVNFDPKVDFTLATGSQPWGVAIGDIDEDGKPDIVVVNELANTISVYRNISTSGSITAGSFAARVDFATFTQPESVTIGDIDGDGKPDVVIGGSVTISVFRNTSTSGSITASSFATRVDFTDAGSDVASIAISDIDGDGKPDIVAAYSAAAASFSVFRNIGSTGTISFATKVDFTGVGGAQSIAVGDIDGDGKPDVAATNYGSSSVSVFHNASSIGSISFTTHVDFVTAVEPDGVTIGDIDGDGKPEIEVAANGGVCVFHNTSSVGSITTSSFASSVTFSDGGTPGFLAIGDIDGDGKPDLAIANYAGNVSVLRNTSTIGSITASSFATHVDFATPDAWGIAVGDIDGDGKADLAVINVSTSYNTVSIFRNDPLTAITGTLTLCGGGGTTTLSDVPGGTWSSANTAVATVGATTGIVTGVGGGTAIISYTLGGASVTAVVTVNGAPIITTVNPLVGYPASAVTITGSGFNTTAANDVVYFGATRATVTAASSTSLSVTVPTGATYQFVTVDNLGCSLTSYSEYPFLPDYNNSAYVPGVVNFDPHVDFAVDAGGIPMSIAIGDIDGDGKPDIVVANASSNTVSVYRNISTSGSITPGSFAAAVDFTIGSYPIWVAIGDIDGDGKPDLVIANEVSQSISVLRNTSTAGSIATSSFAARVDFPVSNTIYCVAIGDLDGDGKPDLVVPSFGTNYVSVFRNTGSVGSITSGSFATPVNFVCGIGSTSDPLNVTIGDLDGDGKPDIAVTNQNVVNTVGILRNTSSAGVINFNTHVDFTTGSLPAGVAIGDIDGDGKPELVVANSGSNSIYVYHNTSSAGSITTSSFAAPVSFTTGTLPIIVAIGDIDGDGKPDVEVENGNSYSVSIFRNTSTIGSITTSSFAAKVDFPVANNCQGITIGDLDGDGKPDIAAANGVSHTISVLRNDPLQQITGNLTVCAGSTTTLSDATTGGVWSSGSTSIATVGATGIVTGMSGGTAVISYTVIGGSVTATVTVAPPPSAGTITGTPSVCVGATTALSDAATGGTWYGATPTIGESYGGGIVAYLLQPGDPGYNASIPQGLIIAPSDQSSGIQWGCSGSITIGTSTAIGSGAANTALIVSTCGTGTAAYLCHTLTLGGYSDWYLPSRDELNEVYANIGSTGGGGFSYSTIYTLYWSSSQENPGHSYVQYFLPGGGLGSGIGYQSNSSNMLVRAMRSFSASYPTWSSSNTAIATVNPSGIVTGVATGTVTISYTVSNGLCSATTTQVVTVNAFPIVSAITGSSSVCQSSSISLSDATTGGIWSSNNTSTATVSSTGTVTGVAGGTAIISYTLGTLCAASATATVTVGSLPGAGTITGTPTVCVGATTSLTDAATGGTWVGAIPVVGQSYGGGTVAYILQPGDIGYNPSIPQGIVSAPYDLTAGSGNPWSTGAGLVGASGTAVGTGAANTAAIISVSGPTGAANVCHSATIGGYTDWYLPSRDELHILEVNQGIIGGFDFFFGGGLYWSSTEVSSSNADEENFVFDAQTSLPKINMANVHAIRSFSATPILTWSSSNTAVATVNSSGVVTGVSAGTATISYTLYNGLCSSTATQTVTVSTAPVIAAITGSSTVCQNATTALSDATTGGVWSSSSTSVATIDISGNVTGVAGGVVTINYAVTNSCGTTTVSAIVNVNPLPATPAGITGTTTMCGIGTTTSLSDITTGGVWSCGNTSIATIGTTGVVTGVSAGSATISYAFTNGCGTAASTTTVTVAPPPSAGTITGTPTVCVGATTALSDPATGGAWAGAATPSVGQAYEGGIVAYIIGPHNGLIAAPSDQGTRSWYSCGVCYPYSIPNNENIGYGASNTAAIIGTLGTNTAAYLCASLTLGGYTDWYLPSVDELEALYTNRGAIGGFDTISGSASVYWSSDDNGTTGNFAYVILFNNGTMNDESEGIPVYKVRAIRTFNDVVTQTWSSSNTAVATVNSSGVVTGVATGTAVISYTVNNGLCSATTTQTITVNPLPITPAGITGTTMICGNATISLSDITTGGVWSSSNTGAATVDVSGNVTGVSGGTTLISYSIINGCGIASASVTVNVNIIPSAGTITGTPTVCVGSTTPLTDAAAGGPYPVIGQSYGGGIVGYILQPGDPGYSTTAMNGLIAAPYDQNSGTGAFWGCYGTVVGTEGVIGIGTGESNTALIVSTCGGQAASLCQSLTLGGYHDWYLPSQNELSKIYINEVAIGGFNTSGFFTLGYWTSTEWSGNNAVYVDFTSGGIGNNAKNISNEYAVRAIRSFNISLPAWSSSNTSIATVNSSGTVTGVGVGTATISYTVYNGLCSATTTQTVTVITAPVIGAITGSSSVCQAATTALSDATTSGVWSSSNTSVATIDVSGNVTGVAGGAVTINYAVTNSCGTTTITATETVNPLPNPGTITGLSSVCPTATIRLSDGIAGGVWSSGSTSVATVGATGIVTGVTSGTAPISYSVTNGCGTTVATYSVTVSVLPNPGAISGITTVCPLATTTLSDGAAGGVWSSGTTGIATVSAAGVVTGVSAGTATISYSVTNVCTTETATAIVTVSPSPNAGTITGMSAVCPTAAITLSDGIAGGVWNSGITSIATVSPAGVVTGVSTGTAIISYSVTNSCGTATVTAILLVSPLPNAGTITSTPVVCVSATIPLSDASPGGIWSSGNTGVATINATGVLSGVSQGIAPISYTVTNSCGTATTTVTATVNPLPNAGTISGTTVVCVNATTPLSDTSPAGIWSSSNTGIATVGATGVVTGVSTGTVPIVYAVTNSCGTATTTVTATVNPLPNAGTIIGTAVVCVNATTPLSDASAGGVWSSSNTSVATVDASGMVTGVSQGTAPISYSVTNSCGTAIATATVTVNPLPISGVITGTVVVCVNATIPLTDASLGGVWSSSNTGVATTDINGTVTGVSVGTAPISYTVTNSCGTVITTATVTVNPLPNAGTISGTTTVCVSATTNLSDGIPGGVWESGTTSIAIVNATGMVTGESSGTIPIRYTYTNSCGSADATTTVTVNPLPLTPAAITGTMAVCAAGATTSLSDITPGGIWSSTITAVATVDITGKVTGVGAGTSTISYTYTNSCGSIATITTVTVNPLPSPAGITGITTICNGLASSLSDVTTGGIWSSSNSAVATVVPSGFGGGMVTALSVGTSTISYTVTNGCGSTVVTTNVTVSPQPVVPAAITGTTIVCAGGAITSLSDITAGGIWSTVNTTVATVNASGIVRGVAAGTAAITYTYTNSCGSTSVTISVLVNPLPDAGTVTGITSFCIGTSTMLSDGISGGTWSSGNTSVATIDVTGLVTSVSAGAAIISYAISNSCGTAYATAVTTVTPPPTAGIISGLAAVCVSTNIMLTDPVSGGTWSAVNADAAVASGTVTGAIPGTDTIMYVIIGACGSDTARKIIVINPLPDAGGISGASSVCVGANITLSDAIAGGTWSAANATATISAGIVAGAIGGMDTIYYAITNVCGTDTARKTIAINPLVDTGVITGLSNVCVGSRITVSDSVTVGLWSASNTNAGIAAGIITGINAGADTISYTVTNSCGSLSATAVITVNPLPDAGTITGASGVCIGSAVTLSESQLGGTWSSSNTTFATINNSGMVSGNEAGIDTIIYTVTNSSSCINKAIHVVTVNALPDAGTISGLQSVCEGAQYNLTETTGGGKWHSGNASLATIDSISGLMKALTPGLVTITYIITVNADGCSNETTYHVTILSAPPFSIDSNVSEVKCPGGNSGSITIIVNGGTGPFQYIWVNGDTIDAINNMPAGIYGVTVKDLSTQCVLADSFTLPEPDSMQITPDVKSDYCKSGNGSISVAVSGGASPYSYLWSTGATGGQIANLQADTYTVTVTDANACAMILPVTVEEGTCSGVVIRTGISPNGDGVNDYWVIEGITDYPNNSVQVFDKWGDMVYEKKNYANDWGGIGKDGKLLPDGTYFYLVKLNAPNVAGGNDAMTGAILIKR